MCKRLAILLAAGALAVLVIPGFALGTGRGTITEFPIPSGGLPNSIVAGPDGNLWFAALGGTIGRITPEGTITEFPTPTPYSNPRGLTVGLDGNIWFAEFAVDKIGRITPAGAITEFPIGRADTEVFDVAAAADGAIWFTEAKYFWVGRLTLDGPNASVTEFNVWPNSQPQGIAAGPDGNLWFSTGRPVVRIKTDGAFTAFGAWDEHAPITAGPDGTLWLGNDGGGGVARIAMDGTLSAFPSVGTSDASGITTGPDGSIWITQFWQQFGDPGQIVRLSRSRSGRVRIAERFVVPTVDSRPLGITAGPDGNIWFTEYDASKIGRLETAKANTAYVLAQGAGFAPQTRRLDAQGDTARWMFLGPTTQQVTDASGMHLFGSGSKSFVSFYKFAFNSAGSYPYRDALHPALTGAIEASLLVSPATGPPSTTFTVTWAATPPRAGFVEDIQIQRPGSSSFADWITGQSGTSAGFVPDAGPGTYAFRARLRKQANGTHSDWSPEAAIAVTP